MHPFTVYFAQIAGLYLVILGLILLVRKEAIIALMVKMADSQPFVFLAGMLRIIIGLAVLVGNGPWGGTTLPIIVALIGWISLVRGIAMLLVTQSQERRLIEFWRQNGAYYMAVIVVLGLGVYLAWVGFTV